ncbi:MAG: site-2 protease family protein [Bacteroidetes bacterium]|nr:MAG: site-2 protease family protein [Bacteroidota bacterium]
MMPKPYRTYALHVGLFLLTVLTTLMVGAELVENKWWFAWMYPLPEGISLQEVQFQLKDLLKGIPYSLSFLAFLTFHEFGHYFTAVYHRVKCTLPYYIPLYIPLPILNIGSLGAVIRLKEVPPSTRKYFDIGIAGPLAGFVVSIFLLVYGFSHLPNVEEKVLSIHPDYVERYGGVPSREQVLAEYAANDSLPPTYYVGTSLIFEAMKTYIPKDPAQVPTHFELMHYPLLFVGYITLFFTALNLLPMGQLDGGHIIYGMFGRKVAAYVSRLTLLALLFVGGTGFAELGSLAENWLSLLIYLFFLNFVCGRMLRMFGGRLPHSLALALTILALQFAIKWAFPQIEPNLIWLIYAFIVVRMLGIDHPPARHEHRVNRPRQLLGWLAIVIFILCFTPQPILVIGGP